MCLAEGNGGTVRLRRNRAFAHGERYVAEREIHAQRLQQLGALYGDLQYSFRFGKREILREILAQNGRKHTRKIQRPALREQAFGQIGGNEFQRVLHADFEFYAAEPEEHLPARIAEGNRLRAAEGANGKFAAHRARRRGKIDKAGERKTLPSVRDLGADIFGSEKMHEIFHVGKKFGIFRLLRLRERLHLLRAEGKNGGRLKPAEGDVCPHLAEGNLPFLPDIEGEIDGDTQSHQIENGGKFRLRLVFAERKFSARQIRKEGVEVERGSIEGVRSLRGKKSADQPYQLAYAHARLYVTVRKIRFLPVVADCDISDLRAERETIHIPHIHGDSARHRLFSQSEGKVEGRLSAEHAAERRRKAGKGGRLVRGGRVDDGLVHVLREIIVVRGRNRLGGIVLVLGIADGDTVRPHPHGRGIFFLDMRGENPPVFVPGVGNGNGLEFGKIGKISRERHLIAVIYGRFIVCRIEIIGLRIGAVPVIRHVRRVENGLLVDQINGKFRSGQTVSPHELVQFHVRVRLAILPLHGHKGVVVLRPRILSACGKPPQNVVPHVAELTGGVHHAARRNVGKNHNSVVVLFVGIHGLRDVDSHHVCGHRAVHFQINVFRSAVCGRAAFLGALVGKRLRRLLETVIEERDVVDRILFGGIIEGNGSRKRRRPGRLPIEIFDGPDVAGEHRVDGKRRREDDRDGRGNRADLYDTAFFLRRKGDSSPFDLPRVRTFFIFDFMKPLFLHELLSLFFTHKHTP